MSPIRKIAAALLFVAGTAVAVPAAAQNVPMVTATNPDSVLEAIRSKGYEANFSEVASGGDPVIQIEADGNKFVLLFYNCTRGKECKTIQYFTGYTDPVVSFERINEWNKTHRFGRAYIDHEGDPVVEMDVDLDHGGLSRTLFLDNLDTWIAIVGAFGEFVTEQ